MRLNEGRRCAFRVLPCSVAACPVRVAPLCPGPAYQANHIQFSANQNSCGEWLRRKRETGRRGGRSRGSGDLQRGRIDGLSSCNHERAASLRHQLTNVAGLLSSLGDACGLECSLPLRPCMAALQVEKELDRQSQRGTRKRMSLAAYCPLRINPLWGR